MQAAQQILWQDAHETLKKGELPGSVISSEGRDAAKEIGVISGVDKILVPVEDVARNGMSQPDGCDDLIFDESIDVNQLWIEVAPPNHSVALVLSKRSAAARNERDEAEVSPVFLKCDDFDRTYKELIGRGAKVVASPAKMPFGWLSMFEDGEGTRFVLGQW